MNKKTIVYVEEFENALAREFISRNDINLILIRFANLIKFFSNEHLELSKDIPTFLIDKTNDFNQECERLEKFIASLGLKVDYFYNDSEFNQVYIQGVARRLCFNGALTEKQANIVRDKYIMKQFVNSIGYKTVEYSILKCKEDLYKCADKWNFPFIVKWKSGVSSMRIFKMNSIEDIDNCTIDFSTENYIGEKYCPYKIWCIDSIVSNGECKNVIYTWLPYTNFDFAVKKDKFAQIAVGWKQNNWKFSPEKLTQDIIDNIGLKNGYLHLECFIDDANTPIVCEFAWRTPGDHVLDNFSMLYDINFPSVVLDAIVGNEVKILPPKNKVVADVFLPLTSGVIKNISTIKDIDDKEKILDGKIFYSTGDKVVSKQNYNDCSGWVQIEATTLEEMLNKIDNVTNAFIIETIEE